LPLHIDDLNRLLYQTEQARRLLVGEKLGQHGLVLGQWLVLDALHKEGASSMSTLAGVIGADRTTLTRTIDGLVAADHVLRTTPLKDRRLVLVELTAGGQALVETILASLATVHASVFADFSRNDLDALSVLLARSLAQIKLAVAEGPRPVTIRLERPRTVMGQSKPGSRLRP
jgi:DNA-binding MarR family transcriptional regulator